MTLSLQRVRTLLPALLAVSLTPAVVSCAKDKESAPPRTAASEASAGETTAQLAGKVLAALERRDYAAAAALFHYPPAYSEAELRQDRDTVARWLEAVLTELGGLSEPQTAGGGLGIEGLVIGGGTEAYWADKPEPVRLVYQVRFGKDGPGFIAMDFNHLDGKLALRTLAVGLPADRPDVRTRLEELGRRAQ